MTKPPSPLSDIDSAIKKASFRLIPLLFLMYTLSYLDRVNVGFAASDMQSSIGLTTAAFGLGSGLFFIGYCLFEFPSNLMMHRFGARLWLSRIMITWGIIAGATAAVQGETTFYAIRILLGVAEAGLLPGVILYLTLWFPENVRGRIMARFFLAMPVAMAFGAPLSSWMITAGDGIFGLSGWQFMFLAQGVPTVALGIYVLFRLPNRPEDARWLSAAEKRAIADALARDVETSTIRPKHSLRGALGDIRLYLIAGVLFSATFGIYAFSFFMPQVVKQLGGAGAGYSHLQIGFVSAIPFAVAIFFTWALGNHSDRTGERFVHAGSALALSCLGVIVAAVSHSPFITLLALTVVISGSIAAIPLLWSIPKTFLNGVAAAGGIGIIGAIANLSGFAAPTITGVLRQNSGSFQSSLILIAAVIGIGCLMLAGLRSLLPRRNGTSPRITKAHASVATSSDL